MRRPLLLLFGTLFTGLAFADARLAADFATFLDWFPGRYDNALQVREQQRAGVSGDERNYRRHSIFRRVDLPAFGNVVFYAEQYRDGDPSKVYRQRIYVLTLDLERDAIRLRVHVPADSAALLGAYRDPALLAELKPSHTRVFAGCDVFWQRRGDRFEGSLEPGKCQFDSAAFGQRVQLEETLTLFEDALWFADRGVSMSGEYLFGMKGAEPAKALRARPLICGFAGDPGRWWTHDQGGEIQIDDDTRSATIRVQRLKSEDSDALTMSVTTSDGERGFASAGERRIALSVADQHFECGLDNADIYADDPNMDGRHSAPMD
ncbi:MAG: chromophore lyase CpcT/CpeT [Pseudomonadota bacterium]